MVARLNSIFQLLQTSLISPSHEEYEVLIERLKDRVEDNNGETIYEIGTGGKFCYCCTDDMYVILP